MKGSDQAVIQISTGTIIRGILLVLLFFLLFYLRDLILVILTAVVIASSIEPAVKYFEKWRISRIPAVIIIYLLFAIFFVTLFYFFVPSLLDDIIGFLGNLPEQIQSLGLTNLSPSSFSSSAFDLESLVSLQQFFAQFKTLLSGASGGFIQAASVVFGGLLSLILIIVLSFYFAVQETGIDDFLRVITPVRHQEYIVNLWKRSQLKIGRWMQGQLLLAVIVGVLVYLGLTILGVPYALLLAILSAAFELIPLFGPILAAIPAVVVAFSNGGLNLGLITVALYIIIQQFENHLIYPLVVRKVVGVPPLLVIIAIIVGAKLAGVLGLILSVPVAAAFKEYVDDIQKAKISQNNNNIPMP